MSQSNVVSGGLAVVGAVVGYYASGGSPYGALQGAAWGWAAGSALGASLADKPDAVEPRIDDNSDGEGKEGVVIPRVYGEGKISLNAIYAGPNNVDRDQKTKNGNKVVTYRYMRAIAWGVCTGPVYSLSELYYGSDKIQGETHTYYLGTETQEVDSDIEDIEGVGKVPAFLGLAYIYSHIGDMAKVNRQFNNMSTVVKTTANGTVALSDIIISELSLVGIPAGEVDVSELTGINVKWFMVNRLTTPKQIIQELQSIYFFDVKDSGDKLTFQLRKNHSASIVTIGAEGLIRDTPEGESSLVHITQIPEEELPKKVEVRYIDDQFFYDEKVQYAERVDTTSNEVKAVELNTRLTAAEAKDIAERLLAQYWLERYKVSFTTTYQYIWLEPCDVVTVDVRDFQYDVYITKMTYTTYQTIAFEGVIYQGSAKAVLGVESGMPGGGTTWDVEDIELADPEGLILMDLPPLNNGRQLQPNMLVSAFQTDIGKYMGTIDVYRGLSLGTLEQVESGDVLPTMGQTTNVIGAGPTNVFDMVNTVVFTLQQGSMKGTVDRDMLYSSWSKRLWLVGDELIQALTETYLGGNSWQLAGLLRGRRGTEDKVGGHIGGERVILLEDEAYLTVGMELPESQDYWVGVQEDGLVDPGDALLKLYMGRSVTPFSPVQLELTEDGVNVTLTWVYRSRRLLAWNSNVDIPRDSEHVGYKVQAIQGFISVDLSASNESLDIPKVYLTLNGFDLNEPILFKVAAINSYRLSPYTSVVRP